MTEADVLTLAQNAVTVILTVAGPVLLANEATLTFIPKVVGIGLVLAVLGSWMLQRLLIFTSGIFNNLPNFIH